jgi:lysozyme
MIKPSPIQVRSTVAVMVLAASTLVGIATHEGYKDEAYVPTKGDVPTIGFGHTSGVKIGDKTTPVRSLIQLMNEVQGVYVDGLKKCITAPLFDYEFAAYISLAYNIGVTSFCRKAKPGSSPNLIELINTEKYEEACQRIEAFVYGPGRKRLPGLVKRRAEERAICEGKKRDGQP